MNIWNNDDETRIGRLRENDLTNILTRSIIMTTTAGTGNPDDDFDELIDDECFDVDCYNFLKKNRSRVFYTLIIINAYDFLVINTTIAQSS